MYVYLIRLDKSSEAYLIRQTARVWKKQSVDGKKKNLLRSEKQ